MMDIINSFDVIIVAAGDFPVHKTPLSILEKYKSNIICCDSAADELLSRGYEPYAVVGDGDSISNEARNALNDRLFLETEQETNDLTKAVRFATNNNLCKIAIIAATGKREDHTLGNISLLADYMDICNIVMFTDYGIFVPVKGNNTIPVEKGSQISFFCMDTSPITLKEVKWPLNNRVITRWWQATLNEAVSDNVFIETGGKVVVFISYQ
jgi:thiamine pyrophosphokinase